MFSLLGANLDILCLLFPTYTEFDGTFANPGPEIEVPLAEFRARAHTLKDATGLQFQKFLAGFRRANQLSGETLVV